MIVKKFNEAYGQERPSSKLVNLMFDTFRKYGHMLMEDEDVKKILEEEPSFKGLDNIKVGDYLVSIKIMKNPDAN